MALAVADEISREGARGEWCFAALLAGLGFAVSVAAMRGRTGMSAQICTADRLNAE